MTELKEKEGGIHYIIYISGRRDCRSGRDCGGCRFCGCGECCRVWWVLQELFTEIKKSFFSFFTLTPSQMWLKRPVYRGFKCEGRCEGRAFTLTPALTLPSHFRHRKVSCQGLCLQNLTKVPEKYSYLVPTVQHRYTNSIAMLHYQYSYAGLSV